MEWAWTNLRVVQGDFSVAPASRSRAGTKGKKLASASSESRKDGADDWESKVEWLRS
jgi:hypothetical protein